MFFVVDRSELTEFCKKQWRQIETETEKTMDSLQNGGLLFSKKRNGAVTTKQTDHKNIAYYIVKQT